MDTIVAGYRELSPLNYSSFSYSGNHHRQPTAHQRRINASQAAMSRIGNVLLADAKAAVYSSDQSNVQSRDLLSLLVRANTATDLPESQRMSDKDVLARKPLMQNLLTRNFTDASKLAQRYRRSWWPATKRPAQRLHGPFSASHRHLAFSASFARNSCKFPRTVRPWTN